jgi:carbonic anhydrase/acetyltransferase-like protein (isoleucine patch superfamily)
MSSRAVRLTLKAIQARDRLRLARLRRRHPGLEIDPEASSNFAVARFLLAPGSRLRIGPRAVTDRVRGALVFLIEAGAEVEIGADTWLRTELEPVRIAAYAGARIATGPECLLNGCHLSAKREVRLGRRVWVGLGSRVFDSDQHDLDSERPLRSEPVSIGDYSWIASDTTLMRGVTVGAHCIVGARSLLTQDLPPHTLAYGQPARPRGSVGDRSRAT